MSAQNSRMADEDEKRWEDRLKRVTKTKDVPAPEPKGPLREKPGKGGDTPNPLPDDNAGDGGGGKGGDPGRT